MSAEAKIEIDDVRHWFVDPRTKVDVEAISHVSTTVADQEFLSIVGPSGCGKTTLLNMIAGLIEPTEGEIKVDGERCEGIRPSETSYMFARDTLLPWRTVQRNVELGLEFPKVPDRAQRAVECLRLVGLDGFEGHYPDQLSHGMRQRVALARTLARNPSLLLMDEPFGALDAQTRQMMQAEFLSVWEDLRCTVVFVTHDLEEAIALSDRVIVFSARPGRIKSEYRIGFPRPRVIHELQADAEFRSLYAQIWEDLKDEAAEANEQDRQNRTKLAMG